MAVSWTCPECGLVYDSISPQDAIQALRSFPRRYREVIGPFVDDDEVLRRKPDPQTWSALEYTAHVADVFDSLTPDIVKMVQQDDPRLPDPWNPDERADVGRYNEMEPEAALEWLQRAATQSADTIANFSPEDWSRTGEFDFGRREVIDTVRNLVHEGVHHLRDVENVLRAVIGKPLPTDDEDD
jgi:hypothetical protein